jgi:hypothetical protein
MYIYVYIYLYISFLFQLLTYFLKVRLCHLLFILFFYVDFCISFFFSRFAFILFTFSLIKLSIYSLLFYFTFASLSYSLDLFLLLRFFVTVFSLPSDSPRFSFLMYIYSLFTHHLSFLPSLMLFVRWSTPTRCANYS